MTTPDRSIEEIVEEFEDNYGAKDYGINKLRQLDESVYLEDVKQWLTQTLQTERQKREEMVEAERERVWLSSYRAGQADARADVDTKDISLTNPNNPK